MRFKHLPPDIQRLLLSSLQLLFQPGSPISLQPRQATVSMRTPNTYPRAPQRPHGLMDAVDGGRKNREALQNSDFFNYQFSNSCPSFPLLFSLLTVPALQVPWHMLIL